MFDSRMNLSKQVREDVSKYYGEKVYKNPIPRNIRLAEAPSFGQSIFEYEPTCRGARAYLDLAIEFLVRRGAKAEDYESFKSAVNKNNDFDFGG